MVMTILLRLLLITESSWNIWLPGFPNDGRPKPNSSGPTTEAHKQRINQIKKSKK